jgi:hypothetical protein
MHGLSTDEALDRIYLALVQQKRMLDPGEVATMVRDIWSQMRVAALPDRRSTGRPVG